MNLLKLAQEKESEIVDDTIELCKIESLRDIENAAPNAPFGPKVNEALEWILNKAKQDGFTVENVDGYAGVISYGNQSESVSMLGHLDVVPVEEGWTQDPFTPVVKDGYIIARGSGDDKGPTVAAYHALKLVKEFNLEMDRKVMLIVGTDEESSMDCMTYFKENYESQPTMGFVPDAQFPVIYGEKGMMHLEIMGQTSTVIKKMIAGQRPNIVIGKASATIDGEIKEDYFNVYLKQHNLKGQVQLTEEGVEYTIEGKSAHASTPHLGNNAAIHLFRFIGGTYDDKLSLTLGNLLYDTFGQGLNMYFYGTHMGELTLNTGIVNIVNGNVSVTLDVRYPHDANKDMLVSKAKHVVTTENNDLQLVLNGHSEPHFVDPKSELVKSCMESYQAITGDTMTPAFTMGGGTYARVLDNHVAFGPVSPIRPLPEWVGGPHENDEGVEIRSLVEAVAIYANSLIKLAAKK